MAIRHYHDSGNTTMMGDPLAPGRRCLRPARTHESAATVAGFAFSPTVTAAAPEINATIAHLREVLGDQTYESLTREGETMTTAEVATYAYNQIDHARATLNAVPE